VGLTPFGRGPGGRNGFLIIAVKKFKRYITVDS
jgi:hypothetical protein